MKNQHLPYRNPPHARSWQRSVYETPKQDAAIPPRSTDPNQSDVEIGDRRRGVTGRRDGARQARSSTKLESIELQLIQLPNELKE